MPHKKQKENKEENSWEKLLNSVSKNRVRMRS